MNTIEFIKLALDSSAGWTMTLIEDMKDSPLTQPTPLGGNHPLWVLGHIVHSESNLFDGFIMGRENRYPELADAFAFGSIPATDAEGLPSMEELLARFRELRMDVMAWVDTITEADLDKPSHGGDKFGPGFARIGGCVAAMITHMTFHAGQVSDARRAAGRPVIFQPETVS